MTPDQKLGLYLAIIVALVLGIVAGVSLASYEEMSKPATAETKWVKCSYHEDRSGMMVAVVDFAEDLRDVSAVHIHKGNGPNIGPIIAWLATSCQWQKQPEHLVSHGNEPCCCSIHCELTAPSGTPHVSDLEGQRLYVRIPDLKTVHSPCNSEEALKNHDVYLVVHGNNFTPGNKWLDIIGHQKFVS